MTAATLDAAQTEAEVGLCTYRWFEEQLSPLAEVKGTDHRFQTQIAIVVDNVEALPCVVKPEYL